MKYMLSDKEKKIFGIVIPLQVLWGRGAGGGSQERCRERGSGDDGDM